MKLLLDMSVLLWWLTDSLKLSPNHRRAIADHANEVFISAATLWEISIRMAESQVELPDGFLELCEAQGFRTLPITPEHAWELRQLPAGPTDPFDRMLITQAKSEGLLLVTSDRAILDYYVGVLAG
ncbi:type II toxin-antitoxin system VapC family toxin [bacterium]|nr:type II toxin-antitoxin system VapC family toxin [bacterium]